MNKLSRKEVFERLNSERDYQLRRWGFRQSDNTFKEAPHSVEEFILYMEDYLESARHRISRENGEEGCLDELRKVVTLGIACFEQNGVPFRDLSQPIINGRDNLPS